MRILAPFRSYRTKLQAAFVGVAALAIAATGWEAEVGGAAALREATLDRLTVIRQTRARQIERYFEDAAKHVLAMAADASAGAALGEMERAWPLLTVPAGGAAAVRAWYGDRVDWMPEEGRALALQYYYLVAQGEAPGAYGATHARFHPTLQRYQTAFGFYDIFLIDASGRVVYTVRKEMDLGVSLGHARYQDTALARAFRRAMATGGAERAVLEDYQPYTPSRNEQAAFIAAPMWRGGERAGVLAIQISMDEVNRVMTGNGHWREEGFGETGQAYMVNAANALRSGLRHGDAPGAPVQGSGTAETADGKRLRSWTPLAVADVQWWLVAEMDAGEALAPVGRLRLRIIAYGLLLAGGFLLLARWLGQGVTAPVLALAEGARRLGARDFRARIATKRTDEIGELAESFNRMAADLEQTTMSKQAVDDILGSLLNAVFVVEGGRVTRANPAAGQLLGYTPEEMMGRAAPVEHVAVGRAAVETELTRRDGTRVPVLVTAGRLENGGVVYAAQDISELRRLAGRLIAAQEDERRRIARELHDDFSQRLAAAAISAGQGRQEAVRVQIGALADELHALSRRLHPAMLDDLGLEAAIAAECRASFERGGPPVDFAVEGTIAAATAEENLAIYRILQEGLRNVARHADAQQVTVRLRAHEIRITDDGRGFDTATATPGLGLASMEERVRLLGGQWTLRTAPGEGTEIVARFPG